MQGRASEEFEAVLTHCAEILASSSASTNLERASRYEILGVIERMRAWRATGEARLLDEARARLGRLARDVKGDQAGVVEQLAERAWAARRVGKAPTARREGPPLVEAGSPDTGGVETLDLLSTALAGLSRGFRRWPSGGEAQNREWPIDNEDAVQRLVWLALAPCFRQLRFEEPVGATGPPRWRPDFVLPRLQLALEVKFVRSVSKWPAIFAQIASDDAYCRSASSPFQGLVVVVWDNSKSTERHDEWKTAVLDLASVHAVTIVSRPGSV